MSHTAMRKAFISHLLHERFDEISSNGTRWEVPLGATGAQVLLVEETGYPSRVVLASLVAEEVPDTTEVAAELQRMSSTLPFGRLVVTDDATVWVEDVLYSDGVTEASFDNALRFLEWAGPLVGDCIEQTLGGRSAHRTQPELPISGTPTDSAGTPCGYL